MAKYLVETYYTCSFKVSHYLDDVNEKNLQNLEKNEDGKFEILDVKLDNRKTKNLEKIDNNSNKVNIIDNSLSAPIPQTIASKIDTKIGENFKSNLNEKLGKRFSMPDRRKGYPCARPLGSAASGDSSDAPRWCARSCRRFFRAVKLVCAITRETRGRGGGGSASAHPGARLPGAGRSRSEPAEPPRGATPPSDRSSPCGSNSRGASPSPPKAAGRPTRRGPGRRGGTSFGGRPEGLERGAARTEEPAPEPARAAWEGQAAGRSRPDSARR